MSTSRISFDMPDFVAASQTGQLVMKDNSSGSFVRLTDLVASIAQGSRTGNIRTNIGAVQASGTVAFSSFVATDTVTINGVVFTGSDTPSGSVQFLTGTGDEASANSLRTVVNACATALIVGVVKLSRRGTIALSSFADGDTITINGVLFTGKTTPTVGSYAQFAIGASDSITAKNAVRAIQASLDTRLKTLIGASSSSTTITVNCNGTLTLAISAHGTATSKTNVVTCLVPGQVGNLCTLAISAHGSVSAANMTGGTEGTQYTFTKDSNAL